MKAALVAFLITSALACGQTPHRASSAERDAEALWKQHDYQGAKNAFEAAVRANPDDLHAKVRFGRLFLERFNQGDAVKLFHDVLQRDPKNGEALLGMALVAEQSFEGKAADLAHEALKDDPQLTEAQELLARLALEDNDSKLARTEADAALKLDPQSLTAEAVHASADLLEHQPADPWLTRIAAEHPHDGSGYELIGHFFEINRRYEDSIDYFHKALDAQPNLDSARSQLGVNLMRLGREADARQQLELAYHDQFRDAATVNTLRLMDSYNRFQTFHTKTTILKLDQKEADVLRLYIGPEFERALAAYQKKYEYKLPRAVQLEVYPNHPDFEVRTTGMPGVGGILGVTFEDVVGMDSPSARAPGEFHWGATLWHELSHVYVLSITGQRVPRWFTEGVAVHEESQVSPDWGDRITPDVVKAVKDHKLLPVLELDRGFVHPKYRSQVIVSYYEAGKIIDFVAKTWGEHKVLDMVHAFAKTDSTAEVIQSQLGLDPATFDQRFLAYMAVETKNDVDHFDSWEKRMEALHASASAKRFDEVIANAPEAIADYPEFIETGNAYQLLADAYGAKGNTAGATGALLRYSQAGGRDPEALKQAASALTQDGHHKEAAQVLERLVYINPLDEQLHTSLGGLYLDLRNTPGAVREYTALVAGKSPDQAAAHFGLARAYHQEKKDSLAKDELLQSLETAPDFKPAQKLLLELNASD